MVMIATMAIVMHHQWWLERLWPDKNVNNDHKNNCYDNDNSDNNCDDDNDDEDDWCGDNLCIVSCRRRPSQNRSHCSSSYGGMMRMRVVAMIVMVMTMAMIIMMAVTMMMVRRVAKTTFSSWCSRYRGRRWMRQGRRDRPWWERPPLNHKHHRHDYHHHHHDFHHHHDYHTIINKLVILSTTSTDPSPSASSGWARETSRTPRLVRGRGARRVNSSWVTSPWWTRLDSRMTIKVTKLAICGDIDDEHSWRQLSKSETLTEFCSCSCGVLGPGSPMQPAKSDLPLSGAWLSPKQSAFCCRTFYDKQYLNFLKFCAKVEKWPEGHKALKIGPVF